MNRAAALLVALTVILAARGERLAAFDGRSIPADGVAPRSNTPGILGRRAWPAGRLARLGATSDVHHGLRAPVSTAASDRYAPWFKFRTIATPRFDIHFHQGQEPAARRLAALAERVASELDATLGRPSGRVQVVLVDQTDLANGWATPVPFNTIEITAATPRADEAIGNTVDWLRTVFTHEYTHIVHLSRGAGWIGGLRRVFGRAPPLYPNLFLPRWQIEGLATFDEGGFERRGRVPAGDFRAILLAGSARGGFEPLDRVNGGLVDWPSGHAPYVYGAYFHDYLSRRYGRESLDRLATATARRLPYFGSTAFGSVYGRSLGELWRDFEASLGAGHGPTGGALRLTSHGFSVTGPRFGPDGTLYYATANPHGFPALMALPPGAIEPVRLVDRYLGNRVAVVGQEIVFDQLELVEQVGLQSDLYAMAGRDATPRRITYRQRAADPDLSPDGRRIACVVQKGDRRELATLTRRADGSWPGEPQALLSQPDVYFAAPRWSPDGRTLVVERGPSAIVLVDVATGRISTTIASAAGGRTIAPSWLPNGDVMYAADSDGAGFRIYRVSLASGRTERLEGTGDVAKTPEVSPDGRRLAFVGYTAEGWDLFAVSLDDSEWREVTPERAPAETPEGPEVEVEWPDPVLSPYRPWRTLAPRYWTPTIESDRDELSVGALTTGVDALGRHAYAAGARFAAGRSRPDWQASYVYDRWWPALFANVSDDTDPWRDGTLREREVNAGVVLPLRRVRRSQILLASLHAATVGFRCDNCPEAIEVERRALRGGWSIDAARSYGYSIGRESGWMTATTIELSPRGLGSDDAGGAATFQVRGYRPLGRRHAVLAARLAAASGWGEGPGRRSFSASGSGGAGGGLAFGGDAVGLLRGLDDDDLIGRAVAVANVDYRVPLASLQRGLGTLPLFVRTVHGALFVDVGHAWADRFRRDEVRTTIGGELSLDTVVGYTLPLTVTGGVAWDQSRRRAAAFGRVGYAF